MLHMYGLSALVHEMALVRWCTFDNYTYQIILRHQWLFCKFLKLLKHLKQSTQHFSPVSVQRQKSNKGNLVTI